MQKPNRSFAKKVFAAGLAVSTAVWAGAGLLALPVAAVDAHPDGSLVLSGGTVWHVVDGNSDGVADGRHGVDSLAKFYSNRFDFSDVVPANSADLALADLGLMPLGSGVLFNDGGTVYQVSGGTKHGFTSAAVFTGLGFSFANVMNAGSLSSVPAGANLDNSSAAHLEGTFVNSAGTIWMVTATGRKGVPSPEVFYSHGGTWGEVVSANAADLALANEGNASFRAGLLINDGGTIFAVTSTTKRGFPTASCFTDFGFSFANVVAGGTSGLTAGANLCDGTTPPPPPVSSTGNLSVTLAGDTPAAGTVVQAAARVAFTKVNLTATGGDVTIDTLTVERMGVSTDSNFTDIILLDVSAGTSVGQANQIGNERSLSSTHKATFGDNITVLNGTTKSIMIAANMAADTNSGDQASLALVDMTLIGSASRSGTLPINGNLMTMNSSVVIASVTVKASASPSATTQNVGTQDYIVAAFQIINDSTEKVEVHSIKLTQNGSAGDNDIANMDLMMDGTVQATTAKMVNKEVISNLATPIVLDKGQTKNFDVRADINDGSGRTIDLQIESKADVVVKGQTFGFFVLPTYQNSAGTADTTSPFYDPADTSIGNGSITFSKGVLSSLNISEGASNQALGAFKSTVQGEAIRVTQLVIGVTTTHGDIAPDISDLVVKDENGASVAGPFDPTESSGLTNMGSATSTDTIVFPVGTHTYTIFGTLNSDWAANDPITLRLSEPDALVTAKGEVTNQTITANPTSDLSLDTVTVKTGGLDVSTSVTPAAQSVIVGSSGFTFANFVFDAGGSGEDVRLTQLLVPQRVDGNNEQSQIANLQLFDGATGLLPIVQPANVAGTASTNTFSFINPVIVTKGTSKTLTLKGDIVSGAAGDDHTFGLSNSDLVTAVGATTGNTVTETVALSEGQTMTIAGSGTLTVATDASSPSSDALLVGGASKVTVGELRLTALNEDIDLTNIHFDRTQVNGGNLNDEFAMVYLFDGTTQIAAIAPTTTDTVTFMNLDGKFVITKGSTGKKMTVKVDTLEVTNNQGDGNVADSGDGVSLSVAEDKYEAKGVSSGTAIAAGSKSGTFTGEDFTVYRSVPTWAKVALSSNSLINSSGVPLFKFRLTADPKGDLGFYKASFAITTTTATLTSFELIEEPNTGSEVNLTSDGGRNITHVITAHTDGKGGLYGIHLLFQTNSGLGVGNGGIYRSIAAGTSKSFELRATVASSTTGSSVSTTFRSENTFNGLGSYPDCAGGAAAGDHPCTGISDAAKGKFVWSDLHFGNSSTTATNTNEWFNGNRVSGLAVTSTAEILTR